VSSWSTSLFRNGASVSRTTHYALRYTKQRPPGHSNNLNSRELSSHRTEILSSAPVVDLLWLIGIQFVPGRADNLDYNFLKHEIKAHTTRNQAAAVAIPGHQDLVLRKFEDGLYLELCRQHDRVDLFIISKADEVSRCLGTDRPSS
jgi:hypothetical protein